MPPNWKNGMMKGVPSALIPGFKPGSTMGMPAGLRPSVQQSVSRPTMGPMGPVSRMSTQAANSTMASPMASRLPNARLGESMAQRFQAPLAPYGRDPGTGYPMPPPPPPKLAQDLHTGGGQPTMRPPQALLMPGVGLVYGHPQPGPEEAMPSAHHTPEFLLMPGVGLVANPQFGRRDSDPGPNPPPPVPPRPPLQERPSQSLRPQGYRQQNSQPQSPSHMWPSRPEPQRRTSEPMHSQSHWQSQEPTTQGPPRPQTWPNGRPSEMLQQRADAWSQRQDPAPVRPQGRVSHQPPNGSHLTGVAFPFRHPTGPGAQGPVSAAALLHGRPDVTAAARPPQTPPSAMEGKPAKQTYIRGELAWSNKLYDGRMALRNMYTPKKHFWTKLTPEQEKTNDRIRECQNIIVPDEDGTHHMHGNINSVYEVDGKMAGMVSLSVNALKRYPNAAFIHGVVGFPGSKGMGRAAVVEAIKLSFDNDCGGNVALSFESSHPGLKALYESYGFVHRPTIEIDDDTGQERIFNSMFMGPDAARKFLNENAHVKPTME